jgi:hypothetical protein
MGTGWRRLALAVGAVVLMAGLAACTGPAPAECEAGVADISRIATVAPAACSS